MSTLRGKDVSNRGLDLGFLCQGWFPDVGGIETHTHDLARALTARGHRVHVLCLDQSADLEPYSTRDAVADATASLRRLAYRYHDLTSLADLAHNPRADDAVLAWLAETPCDLVHVHHTTGFGLGALRAIRDVGQPLVMTLHDYWPLCPRGQMLRVDGALCRRPEPAVCGPCLAATFPTLAPSGGGGPVGPEDEPVPDDAAAAAARTAYALRCLSLPHALIAPSEPARATYAAAGLPAERVRVVENGIDAAALARDVARLRSEHPRTGGPLKLGVLGAVIPSKGVLELARALRRARAPDLVLDVHGDLPSYHGDHAYADALRALAADEPRVRLHGPYRRADLARILAGLDGVAAPARWEEVYGLTVREAAAAGLPVLVSDAGGLPALAAGGRAGLVVPRDDEDAWVRALERFASDAPARAAWAGARTALRTLESMAEELERLYLEVVRTVAGRAPAGAAPAAPAPPAAERRSFLGRLFGRDPR